MITNFIFEKNGSFTINGTIDFAEINLEIQKSENITELYREAITKMLGIKKTIIKCLSNDSKIIGNERIEVIKSIDHFLTLLFGMALLYSDTPLLFTCEIPQFFPLNIQANKAKVFKIMGNLINVSEKDLTNYNEWLEKNIFNLFKEIITLSNQNKANFINKLVRLLFNTIILRYKVEYI